MFELLAGAIGAPLAKFLVKQWLGDSAATAVAGGLVDYLKGRLGSEREARRAARQVEELAERIVDGLQPFFAKEQGKGLDLQPVLTELQLTLDERADAPVVIAQRLDPERLYQHWLESRPTALHDLGEAEAGAYRTLLRATAAGLVAIAEKLPRFQASAVGESLKALDGLVQQSDQILRRVIRVEAVVVREQERRATGEADYDTRYRARLRGVVSKLRLFGLDLDPETPTDLSLSIAYIPLHLAIGDGAKGGARQLDYAELLALLPAFGDRLLVVGPAGSGKTTLLQWTALSALAAQAGEAGTFPDPAAVAARLLGQGGRTRLPPPLAEALSGLALAEDPALTGRAADPLKLREARHHRRLVEGKAWHGRTPFLVRLRDCGRDGRLPRPVELPALLAREAGDPPTGWVEGKLQSGDALLLLDGIDEVADQRRDEMCQSIRGYLDTYPHAAFIVTSRPAAVQGGDWAGLLGPWRAVLQPLAPIDIERCIEQWHEALAAECGGRGVEPPEVETASELAGHVLASPALTQLAETPLLCAAICYLHRVRRGELPRRAASLHEELCKQLVHRLDAQRLKDRFEGLAAALAGLDLEDKLALLARLAQFMIREQAALLDARRATAQLRDELDRLRKRDGRDPAQVLAALQERSGVLRGASPDEVEFAHNALRSWLAAGVFAGEGAVVDLVDKALATDDPDLPMLAAARGTTAYRERLVVALLKRADGDAARRRQLQIMALRCAGGPIDSAELRATLDELERQVLPPRDVIEAGRLAELGPRILPSLRRSADQAPDVAAACVRALRLIGGTAARDALDAYLDHAADVVIDELAQAINPLRLATVRAFVGSARTVGDCPPLRHLRSHDLALLEPAATSVLYLEGSGLRDAEALRRFTELRTLRLDGTGVTSLEPLRGLAQLEWLWLDGTGVPSLEPLRGLARLEGLWLGGIPVASEDPVLRALKARGVTFLGP